MSETINPSIEGSVNWKKESFDVLFSNWHTANDKTMSLLFQAVADRGNGWAVRKGSLRKATCDWLVQHRYEIPTGELNIFSGPDIGMGVGRQISAISKICHIINPHCYPVIWDSHIKDILKANESNWDEKVKQYVTEHEDLYQIDNLQADDWRERIYRAESTLWASWTPTQTEQ